MGTYMSTPVTEKTSHSGTSKRGDLSWGSTEMQGWRMNMEDAYLAVPNFEDPPQNSKTRMSTKKNRLALFGVFDGHGGRSVSRFVKKTFPERLRSVMEKETEIALSLTKAFMDLDRILKSEDAVKPLQRQERLGEEVEDKIMAAIEAAKDANDNKEESGPLGDEKKETRASEDNVNNDDDDDERSSEDFKKKVALFNAILQSANLAVGSSAEEDSEEDNARGDEEWTDTNDEGAEEDDASSDDGDDENDGHPAWDCGCTAVVSCLNLSDHKLTVANSGDSRCVLSRGGVAVAMSRDHKPTDEEETARIQKAGGVVTENGRVDGCLNLSRSFGDFRFKNNKELPPAEQRISCCPDVREVRLTDEDEFFVLACDGIWEVLSNQEVVDFVRERLANDDGSGGGGKSKTGERLSKICEDLCDRCISNDPDETDCLGCDNMTVLIVQLKQPSFAAKGQGSGGDNDDESEVVTNNAIGRGDRKRPLRSYLLRPRKIPKPDLSSL